MWMGIDPGASGGIAVISQTDDGACAIKSYKMPETERDVCECIRENRTVLMAMIENVHSMPGQGVKGVFTFGRNYGLLRGILIALQIPFEEVSPGVWQRSMGCLSKGDKNVTKAKAQQMFPSIKIGHATADAILLAEFCRRRWKAFAAELL